MLCYTFKFVLLYHLLLSYKNDMVNTLQFQWTVNEIISLYVITDVHENKK